MSASRAFHGNLPTEETDAQSIYSVLLDWLKNKDLQSNKVVGMSFDGAATFAGKKSGVQAHMRKSGVQAPHSVFGHCHRHKLQLACVQSATALRESNMCIQHSLHCGNVFAICQRDVRI